MEPITYFLSLGGLLSSYLILSIKGHSFDFRNYFKNYRKEQIERKIYSEYDINISDFEELKAMELSLEEEELKINEH
jgi:hypothetical protein